MKIVNVLVAVGVLTFSIWPTSGQQTNEGEPQSADEAYRRGTRLLQTQHPDDAIAMFGKAIVLKPDFAVALEARGRALSQARRYAEAIKDFDQAIQLDTGHAAWYDNRGLAYSNSGQHVRAIEDYRRAIELNSTVAAYYNNRGWAYSELGQFENAIADLSRAIQLAPDYARAFENRGTAYVRMKDWQHAIADYTAAIQIAPSASLFNRRADAKLASGDQAGAAEDRTKGMGQQAVIPSPNAAASPGSTGSLPGAAPAAPGAYRIGNGVSPPRLLSKVEPEYSEEARMAGLAGTVVLFVVVTQEGTPTDFRVLRTLGLGLDEKAIDAVNQWKFAPGTKEGKAVAVQATIEVNFRLLDKPEVGWRLTGISFQPPVGASRPHVLAGKRPNKSEPGETASITLSFEASENGSPINLQVEKTTDPKLEPKAMEALRAWKFSPGLKEGKPVATHASLTFTLGNPTK
jgi:TonB family protein